MSTTPTPMTLTAFLMARIAEDEEAARVCAEVYPPPWDVVDRGHSAKVSADAPLFLTVTSVDQSEVDPARWPGECLAHIARHDPARVLAECQAKRQIVAEHPHEFTEGDERLIPDRWGCRRCHHELFGWCSTLRALALPYAHHPDFDFTWSVSGGT